MPIRRIDEVKIRPGRVRQEFSPHALDELEASILSVGLLHPPVVEADGHLLVGERRYRVLLRMHERGLTYHCNGKFISHGLIATTDIRDLSPTQRLAAEVEENTIRVDLTWQEKAEATQALHRLREAQKAEAAADGTVPPTQTTAETASEIRGKLLELVTPHEDRDVRADLLVATWLANHPTDLDVAGAKTRAEALRAIETRLEDEHRTALAREFMRARPTKGHIIKLASMLDVLPKTPDSIYDCIVTDPPWGVGASEWSNLAAIRRHSYVDNLHTFEIIHQCLATEGFRIAKPRAHLYLFCEFRKFDELVRLFRSVGWDVWPRPLIWFRGTNSGIAPRPEHGPRNCYETILFANKGNKRVIELKPDVITAFKPGEDLRAAMKPPAVYFNLLSRSTIPGDEVLDPCCGSGSILPAANALRLRATCYDNAEDAIGLTSSRRDEAYEHAEVTFTYNKRTAGVPPKTKATSAAS